MPRRTQPPDSIANTRRKNNTKKEKKENRKKLLEHVITHGIDPEIVNLIKCSSSSGSVFDRLQPVAQAVLTRIVIEVAPPPEASTSSSVEQPATSGIVQHRQVIELNPSSSDDVRLLQAGLSKQLLSRVRFQQTGRKSDCHGWATHHNISSVRFQQTGHRSDSHGSGTTQLLVRLPQAGQRSVSYGTGKTVRLSRDGLFHRFISS